MSALRNDWATEYGRGTGAVDVAPRADDMASEELWNITVAARRENHLATAAATHRLRLHTATGRGHGRVRQGINPLKRSRFEPAGSQGSGDVRMARGHCEMREAIPGHV